MNPITNLDEFTDEVMRLTAGRNEFTTDHLMKSLNNGIQKALKENKSVSADVFTIWFHLYSLLGARSDRGRIRVTVLGIKSWLQVK